MMDKRCSFYQNDRGVCLLVIHCSATRCDLDFQLSPAIHKACPCFEARKEYEEIERLSKSLYLRREKIS